MDNINNLTFASLYEHIDSSINKFPFFTNGHGNLFIIRDATIPILEPSEEKRLFYCKPPISDCTALVLVPDNSNNASKNSIPMSSSISNIVGILENRRTADGDNGGVTSVTNNTSKRLRAKEQGIVIKVKKNQDAKEAKEAKEIKEDKELNHMTDLKEDDDKNKNKNKNSTANQHIDVQDFILDEEEEFGPLI
jgi:hypothetical protein